MGAMMPESANPVQQSTTDQTSSHTGLERVNGPSARACVERVGGKLAWIRRDRCLDCSFQSLHVHRLNQMFGKTSRETFLYISHSTEAADCDAANGRIAS